MGIYDRDYYGGQRPGTQLRGPRTMVGWIILINVVVFLADGVFTPFDTCGMNTISNFLACKTDTLLRPWLWWQFITYGFAHAPFQVNPWHIVFNMLGLYFLGPPVEQRYGSREFLRVYMAMVIFGGILYSAISLAEGGHGLVVGASGAVTGVVLLFAVNFPRQTLLLFFVLPVPAWVVGVLIVITNLFGQAGYGDEQVAYGVHLAGIAFAGAYYYFGWNLTRLTGRVSFDWLKRRPKLRVHSPDQEDNAAGDKLRREVDRILEKIHQQGEASLTRKERRTLEAASREYQKNKRDS